MSRIITMEHGAGGTQTLDLIRSVFRKNFENPLLNGDDAAVLPMAEGKTAFTTDAFVVSPAFFPGGDIGKLSVCGTVNDLACMGARPLYLACSFVIEEGLDFDLLGRIAASMAAAAEEAGAAIVAGDTKVVRKGQCDGVYITTTGIGRVLEGSSPGCRNVREGDAVIVTGDIGRHGAAVLVSRGEFGMETSVASDCAPLWGVVRAALEAEPRIHCMRDATRGGVATVLHEISGDSGVSFELDEKKLPISREVRGICGLLGMEPLYLACEGRILMFVPKESAEKVLAAVRKQKYGENAEMIGEACGGAGGRVVVRTEIGGKRLLAPPSGELVPRIC